MIAAECVLTRGLTFTPAVLLYGVVLRAEYDRRSGCEAKDLGDLKIQRPSARHTRPIGADTGCLRAGWRGGSGVLRDGHGGRGKRKGVC